MKNIPRVVIAAHRGGAGKTLLSVGLVAALRKRGLSVAAFKKGPDYIDSGWLGLAAGADCYNLDAYLFDKEMVRASFMKRSLDKEVAIVEGNRGLFDGVDASGSYSTAELAKLLRSPVILLVDATKMTRTAAALVVGCRALDPELDLRGVILNRVAGERHENVLRESIESSTGVPVLGSVRKLGLENLPQRHLGLLPWHEHPRALAFIESAARIVEESADLTRVLEVARAAPVFSDIVREDLYQDFERTAHSQLCIGVLRDTAFQFYYPENLAALGKTGARIMEISALDEHELPLIDALYVGGGFPETHASTLAENHQFRESLRNAVQAGLPVYAECGGLLYLSRNLVVDANVYPMAGVLPVETILKRKPQGHGYVRAEVCDANPFYPVGTQLTGHEFHYSCVSGLDQVDIRCALRVTRGQGIDGERDGICTGNVLATYLHVHALGTPQWADGILKKAQEFQRAREQRSLPTP